MATKRAMTAAVCELFQLVLTVGKYQLAQTNKCLYNDYEVI